MRLFFHILIINILFLNSSFSNTVYDSKFERIEILNQNLYEAKLKEIDNIKLKSLKNILEKILLKDELNKLKRSYNLESKINYLIKNILIENEFTARNIYQADIKVNFDKEELINLLRSKKINYTDFKSPKYLMIIAEEKEFEFNGLSAENSFYKFNYNNNNLLIETFLPDLSANDRYILPYDKIINADIFSLKSILKKYRLENMFLVSIKKINNINKFIIKEFNLKNNLVRPIFTINLNIHQNDYSEFYLLLNKWWKLNNIIDNSLLNNLKCHIKSKNFNELQLINFKLDSISQVKSNIVKTIEFNNNYNEIFFYGHKDLFYFSLNHNGIDIAISDSNECLIKLKS